MESMPGKGLEALIPKKGIKPVKFTPEKESVFLIEIEKIKSNPYQPRKDFNRAELESLSESIKEHGILQPLIVTKIEKEVDDGRKLEVGYELIAGERRLQAAKMAGFLQVPVIIRKPTDQQKLELSLVENVQREDLNSMEKAQAFKKLMGEFDLSQKEIAQKIGKSREAVANALRLLNLPQEIQKGIQDKKISEGHARAILLLRDEKKQKNLFERIMKKNLSVRETEQIAHNILYPSKKGIQETVEEISKDFKNLEEKLRNLLEAESLTLKVKEGKPILTIEFKSEKELKAFQERISR